MSDIKKVDLAGGAYIYMQIYVCTSKNCSKNGYQINLDINNRSVLALNQTTPFPFQSLTCSARASSFSSKASNTTRLASKACSCVGVVPS